MGCFGKYSCIQMLQMRARKSFEEVASRTITTSQFPGKNDRLRWTCLGRTTNSELTMERPNKIRARKGKSAKTAHFKSRIPATSKTVRVFNTMERKLE